MGVRQNMQKARSRPAGLVPSVVLIHFFSLGLKKLSPLLNFRARARARARARIRGGGSGSGSDLGWGIVFGLGLGVPEALHHLLEVDAELRG